MFRHKRYYLAIFLLLFWIAACNSPKTTEENTSKTNAEDTQANAPNTKPVILFFGNSLSAGYGLDPSEAFPALIQQKIDSLGLDYMVINAGISGETTATGNSRIDWVLDRQEIAVFVLELGANDGLRGIPTKETKANLISMIDKVRAKYPQAKIVLAGMMIPPNLGVEYSRDFQQIFPTIAKEKNVKLIPFLLENVAGIEQLNLPDGIHPNTSGQKIVANNVWQILQPEL